METGLFVNVLLGVYMILCVVINIMAEFFKLLFGTAILMAHLF